MLLLVSNINRSSIFLKIHELTLNNLSRAVGYPENCLGTAKTHTMIEIVSKLLIKLLGYLSKVAPKIFKSCSFHEKVAQKLLFINSKKSVSTTDESKSLHIFTNYLLIYIFLSTR